MRAKMRYMGLEAELITPEEAHELFPLLDPKQFVGAMHSAVDGHLDPSGTTHAYAKAARKRGAEIHRETKVEELIQNDDLTWSVVTNKGTIIAEHVVNAGGLWAREVGRMVGLELPVLAMEHMYLLTEDMPEVAEINAKTGKEVIHAVDFDGELYLRQERGGMLMGTYEKACKPWSPSRRRRGTSAMSCWSPTSTGSRPRWRSASEHFPAFQNAGIKQIINGPFTFAPDGNPLVGPVKGLPGYWCACGVMAGFSQGGGVGLALSNWMTDGDPGFDVWGMDVARFGDWATHGLHQRQGARELFPPLLDPLPQRGAAGGAPLKTTPLHDRWARWARRWA
jgi:dimethylglycine dehydrogenase